MAGCGWAARGRGALHVNPGVHHQEPALDDHYMTLAELGSWELVGTHDWLQPEKNREASAQTTERGEVRVTAAVTCPVVASPEEAQVPSRLLSNAKHTEAVNTPTMRDYPKITAT